MWFLSNISSPPYVGYFSIYFTVLHLIPRMNHELPSAPLGAEVFAEPRFGATRGIFLLQTRQVRQMGVSNLA